MKSKYQCKNTSNKMPIEKNHSVYRSLAFNPSFQREKEMRSDVNLRLTLQKSSSISDFTKLSSPLHIEQQFKMCSDLNNKNTLRQSISASDLTGLSSSRRITPQPVTTSHHTTVVTHFQFEQACLDNNTTSPVVAMPHSSVLPSKDNTPMCKIIPCHSSRDNHNSSSLHSYTKNLNNMDTENGLALHLDAAVPVQYAIKPCETLADTMDVPPQSHNECFTSSNQAVKKQPTGRVLKKVPPVPKHLHSPYTNERLSAARNKKRMLEKQLSILKQHQVKPINARPPASKCTSGKYTPPAHAPPTSSHYMPSSFSPGREIVPSRTTSFNTTVETCLEDFERYLLPTGNANPSIATLEGSTHHNGYAHKICDVKQPRLQTPSASNYGFLDLMDDTIMHALSYLTSADVRSVSVTCHDIRSLLTNPGAAQYLWMNICKRESWGSSLNIFFDSSCREENRSIKFRDDLSIPVAGVAQSDVRDINLPVLLGLAANSYPSAIDPAFFQNNIGREAKYNVNRQPPEFRTYHMTCRFPCHDEKENDKLGTETLAVVQFSSRIGVGDRCIKSDQPFPRLQTNKGISKRSKRSSYIERRRNHDSSSSRRRKFPTLRGSSRSLRRGSLRSPDSNSSSLSGDSIILPHSAPSKKDLSRASTLRPFVAPRVVSEEGDNVEVDVTPSLMAYFEVTILPRQEAQEPPLIGSHSASSTSSSQAAFTDAISNFEEGNQTQNGDRNGAGDVPPPPAPRNECVVVGLSTASFDTHHNMPGWDDQSYGYHGDDGAFFHARKKMTHKHGPTFGVNDTVGCGIDYISKRIFYSWNGKFVGFAFSKLDDSILRRGLYPTVGVDTNCPLFVNFGERPFAFDLAPFRKWEANVLKDGLSGLFRSSGARTR
mmetsp:Transcript_37530/g.54901  ORF Transcript_37530/g.54901 Transcript_37530/m.54901 type:complete len:883 (+) Transcript_37530:543-3191(+)